MELKDKLNANRNNSWKTKQLKRSNSEKYRFKIKNVKKEMALAYLVDFEDTEHWIPKSICEIGIDPTGMFYSIDLPEWAAKKYKLI